MTPAALRLQHLRRDRGLHLAWIAEHGPRGTLAEYHRHEAGRLDLEIERLEIEVEKEGKGNG